MPSEKKDEAKKEQKAAPQKPQQQQQQKPQQEKPKEQKQEQPSDYEVKSGDNLSNIAKQQGKSLDEILKLNPGIKDPNVIKPGQKIKVK